MIDTLESTDDSNDPNEIPESLKALPGLRRLEAVLFLARQPLGSRKLSHLAGLADGTQARSLVRELNRYYDQAGRAFNIQQVAGGFQLRTRPAFSLWLTRLNHSAPAVRLTGPALETLAVVAYRQPVAKADVEAVRGVGCGELLRQLLDRGMVRIAGRGSELGNPYLYATTRRFLEVFGLASLDALPRATRLRGQGLPARPVVPRSPGNAPGATETRGEVETSPGAEKNPPESSLRPLDETPASPQNPDFPTRSEKTPPAPDSRQTRFRRSNP